MPTPEALMAELWDRLLDAEDERDEEWAEFVTGWSPYLEPANEHGCDERRASHGDR